MRRLLYRLVTIAVALSAASGAISQIDQIRTRTPDPLANLTETVWDTVTGAADTVIPFWEAAKDATGDQSTESRADGDVLRVVNIVDGDTLDVAGERRVRLVGVNTPEKDECGGDLASATLKELILEEHVLLRRDNSDVDSYGRLLRYVEHETLGDVGEVMVSRGVAYARTYPPDTARDATYQKAQHEARQRGEGVWEECRSPHATTTNLGLRVVADPQGPDLKVLNQELVEISNEGDRPAEMGGWTLRDESSSNRFNFPNGYTLAAGATVLVHSGCGQSTRRHQYWCATDTAIWNNSGDTATLLDASGLAVTTRKVGGEE